MYLDNGFQEILSIPWLSLSVRQYFEKAQDKFVLQTIKTVIYDYNTIIWFHHCTQSLSVSRQEAFPDCSPEIATRHTFSHGKKI